MKPSGSICGIAPAAHTHPPTELLSLLLTSVLTDNAHPHHCIKVYIDKQHTRSIWCLQLTHSETSTHTVRPRLVQQQHERACESSCHNVSNFSTCWELRWSPSRASKLSTCYLHTGSPPALLADMCLVYLSAC